MLIRCTVEDCTSAIDGGGVLVGGGSMELVSSTIARCTAPERGSAIRALPGSHVLAISSEVTECSGHLNGAINVAGKLALTNGSRIRGCSTRHGDGAGGGGLAVEAGGAALLIESDIVDCSDTSGWSIIYGGGAAYVSARGSLQLLNVQISNCIGARYSTAITVGADASLTAARLTVTPPCGTAWEDISKMNQYATFMPPAIYAHPDALQFSLSELRVMMPDGCNMSEAELVTTTMAGIEDWTLCGASTCGPAADCTLVPMVVNATPSTYALEASEPCRADICRDTGIDNDCCNSAAGSDGVDRSCAMAGYAPFPGGFSSAEACNADDIYQCCPKASFVMNLSTPTCACPAPLFPVPDSTTAAPFLNVPLDELLVPFISGCASPRQVGSASVMGETSANVVMELHKDQTHAPSETVTIALHMVGYGGALSSWSIDPSLLPSWLTLARYNGTITTDTAPIIAMFNASGVAELAATYEAQLPFYVRSQQDAVISVPVLFTVSASVVAARSTWGAVDEGARCSQATHSSTAIISQPMHTVLTVPFTACDLDGLPVAHRLPSTSDARAFSVSLHHQDGVEASSSGTEYTAGVHYLANGRYELRLELLVRRNFTVTLLLGDQQVGVQQAVRAVCPATKEPLPNGFDCGCQRGSIFNEETALCEPCPVGHYGSEQRGAEAACLPCPTHATTEAPGSVAIESCVCNKGFLALANGVTCGCTAGQYLDVDAKVCLPCPIGEYCSEGATLGTRCPVGFTTSGPGAEGLDECGCPTGTYDSATADAAGATSCKPCNGHMDCTRTGLTLATVPLLPSRWRLSNRTASAYKCTSSACLGSEWNGTTNDNKYCAQGYEGPRCEWCSDPDRYYDATTATCKDCGDMAGYALRQIVILLAIAVALGILRAAVLRAPRLLVRTSRRLAQAATSMQQFGLQAKFKCCLTFYQVYAVRKSVYGFELPGSLGGVMAFFDALSFDVGSFIFPSWTCLGGLTARLVFSGLWPLVLMAMLALCLFGLEAARKAPIQRALVRSLEAFVFISFCVLPSVTRSLFVAFQCESFGFDDSARPPESRTYLLASLNIECHTSAEHELIYITAYIFIVLWPVAMPLLYAALLFRCRHAILKHQPSTLSRAIRFLWFDYEDRCFWFEMVELGQKLVLTNFLLLVNLGEDGGNKLLRLFIGLLIALFGLTLQLILQPFRKHTDDAIACGVRLMLVLFFIMGIMIKLCDTDGVNTVHSLLDAQVEASASCFTLVGVHTAEAVAWLILIAGLLVVLVPFGLLVQELAFSQSIPILRDAQTMEPPMLLLRAGERYHLFLSHVWSTGQDQCAVIKRQLQLLLPGVVIFLDVDGTVHLPLPAHPTHVHRSVAHPLRTTPLQICRISATWRATCVQRA